MVFWVAPRHVFHRTAVNVQGCLEGPGVFDFEPPVRLVNNGVPNLCQRRALRVPDADPAVNATRFQVQVEARCVLAPLMWQMDRTGHLVWRLVPGKTNVAIDPEDRSPWIRHEVRADLFELRSGSDHEGH